MPIVDQLLTDEQLQKVIDIRSWKFEYRDRLHALSEFDYTVHAGDNIRSLNTMLDIESRMTKPDMRLDTGHLGLVMGGGGSKFLPVSRGDILRMRVLYEQTYGSEVDSWGFSVPSSWPYG